MSVSTSTSTAKIGGTLVSTLALGKITEAVGAAAIVGGLLLVLMLAAAAVKAAKVLKTLSPTSLAIVGGATAFAGSWSMILSGVATDTFGLFVLGVILFVALILLGGFAALMLAVYASRKALGGGHAPPDPHSPYPWMR